jgi:hypothetical protein
MSASWMSQAGRSVRDGEAVGLAVGRALGDATEMGPPDGDEEAAGPDV